jgi:hypothetical protein
MLMTTQFLYSRLILRVFNKNRDNLRPENVFRDSGTEDPKPGQSRFSGTNGHPNVATTIKKNHNIQYIFYRLRHIINRQLLLTVYQSLAVSIIQYGIIAWGGAYKATMDRVTRAQKLLLKIILKENKRYSTTDTYENSKVLDVRQIFIKTILMYFRTHFLEYQESQSRSTNTASSTHTRSHSKFNLTIPMRRKQIGQQSADFIGTHIFNQLPLICREARSDTNFKYQINNWLKSSGRDKCKAMLNH